MESKPIRVLLVEDNLGDADLLQETLAEGASAQFELTGVSRLGEALQRLFEEHFDVVLLDLGLPDSQGLDTFVRTHAAAPDVPIVVLTGLDDEMLAVKAVQAGAQDYLVKGQVDSNLLVRSLRYAIERHRLLAEAELEQARQKEQQEREFHSLERLSGSSQTAVTARTFGLGPLHESVPDAFDELVQRYGCLMDLALEQRAYKVEHNISEALRAIGEQISFLKASPRDVVEIHSTALKMKTEGATPHKVLAYAEEGRLMVLELMGYLASCYRNYSLSSQNPRI